MNVKIAATRSPARRRWRPFLAGAALAVLTVAAYLVLPPAMAYWSYQPRPGDVVFQSLPHMALVDAIEGVTHSPFSHCGIVAEEGGRWYVYEALGSVRRVPLWQWIAQGRERHFAAYRLKESHRQRIPQMIEYARQVVGRPYDIRYDMDDEKIYCSELVFKGYRAAGGEPLGQVVRFGDLDWRPYESFIRQLEQGPVPVDRQMIPPRQLSEAPQLDRVFDYGFPPETHGDS